MVTSAFDLKRKDFELAFESQGVKFIFEDLVHKYYVEWESVMFQKAGRSRVFHHKDSLEHMHKVGFARTIEDTQKKIDALNSLVAAIPAEITFCKNTSSLTVDDAKRMFGLLSRFCKEYSYFEAPYWEQAFTDASADKGIRENVAAVQNFKNVIREELNKAFFGPESLLEQLVTAVSVQTDIPSQDLFWYLEDEIVETLSGVRVTEEVLAARRMSFSFYVDQGLHTYALYGQEALDFIETFGAETQTLVTEIKGTTAHGKGTKVTGRAYVMSRDYADDALMRQKMRAMPQDDILVTETTDPGMMEAFHKASAVVTNIGGLLSHAAITARELNIPCIVGTERGTRVIKTGDTIEVDAGSGVVRIVRWSTDWELYLSRPFDLLTTSIWNEWYTSPHIERVLGVRFTRGLFVESPRGVSQHYRLKEDLKQLRESVHGIVLTDVDKACSLFERGEELNEAAKSMLSLQDEGDISQTLDFIIELAIHSTVFPLLSGDLIASPHVTSPRLKEMCERLRSVSYYPDLLSKIVIPKVEQLLIEKGYEARDARLLTIREVIRGSFDQIPERRGLATTQSFIFEDNADVERVSYVSDGADFVRDFSTSITTDTVSGMSAYPGTATGRVRLVLGNNQDIEFNDGDILVAISTNPVLLPLMKKAGAIVTDEGGVTCHAAIIARELKKPCIVGTRVATKILKEGDKVVINAGRGEVRIAN